jgi:hypothetical protein
MVSVHDTHAEDGAHVLRVGLLFDRHQNQMERAANESVYQQLNRERTGRLQASFQLLPERALIDDLET